ncbi:MAG: isoprenylcysteine carboxylmethyltransferase family protein [Anaerolineales bacterium]|jgi:protein-S-isoprenylcysteine O-methyltransferase Ste14
MATSSETQGKDTSAMKHNIVLRARKDFIGTLVSGIVLFLAAGRLDWTMGWVYLGLYLLGIFLNLVVMTAKNPELYAIRSQITQEDTEPWDKVFHALYGPLLLLIMAVTGLDGGRYGWSNVPIWLQWVSVGLFIASWLFSLWAMVANKHFETSVRVQTDRDQTTVTGGPYAIVRHPGYAGIILLYAVTPLFLGSWWGLIPAGLLAAAFVYRTAMEDKMLHEELPDYQAYAEKVRYKLVPGIW